MLVSLLRPRRPPRPTLFPYTTLFRSLVTGSLFSRTDTETPSPVTVLSSETMAERGINTVAEAIQRIPANNAGTIQQGWKDRKSTRLNSSHVEISYAVFCLKKKTNALY